MSQACLWDYRSVRNYSITGCFQERFHHLNTAQHTAHSIRCSGRGCSFPLLRTDGPEGRRLRGPMWRATSHALLERQTLYLERNEDICVQHEQARTFLAPSEVAQSTQRKRQLWLAWPASTYHNHLTVGVTGMICHRNDCSVVQTAFSKQCEQSPAISKLCRVKVNSSGGSRSVQAGSITMYSQV